MKKMNREAVIDKLEDAEIFLHLAADALRPTYPGDNHAEHTDKLAWALIAIAEVIQHSGEIDEEERLHLYSRISRLPIP